uniref:F-box domain-containing protein n=1 Tax=Caenorhabditis tropicalis TaxID=1561998 RepID=A0A1I7UDU1_9PELO
MNSKPLTYDSLKTVIEYMDPNTRFLLSSRAPSIRSTERVVPLRIGKLVFNKHEITVNQTVYEYGIYQVDNEVPYKISGYSTLSLKWTHDVDEFGTRDYITEAGGMLPGNNGEFYEYNLFGCRDSENVPTNEGRLQKLRRILEVEKQRLDQLMNYRPTNRPNFRRKTFLDVFSNNIFKLYTIEDLEEFETQEMLQKGIEYKKERIKQMEKELILFENKKYNIRPRFEIHLTKRQGDSEPCVIERLKYTGDLHKAEVSLREFMFSKRHHIIQVRKLTIYENCPIPISPKMRITCLSIREGAAIESVKLFIHESSLPLEKLKLNIETQGLDHDFIRTSKILELYGEIDMEIPDIQNLSNPKVEFDWANFDFFFEGGMINLIKNWIETDKPIGTCFIFHGIHRKKNCIVVMNLVRAQIDGAVLENKCVDIPMNKSSILKVSYEWSRKEALIRMDVVPHDFDFINFDFLF